DRETCDGLAAISEDAVIGGCEITEADIEASITAKIPTDFEAMAKLPRLGYPTPRDKLAERFHMAESLLATLNPGVDFTRAGIRIVVADVPQKPRHVKVTKIV